MQKKLFFLLLIISPFFANSQDFTDKDLKRMRPILKRSNLKIDNFNHEAIFSVQAVNKPGIKEMMDYSLFLAGFNVLDNQDSNPIQLSDNLNQRKVPVYRVSIKIGETVPAVSRCHEGALFFSARIIDTSNSGLLVGTFTFSSTILSFVACEQDLTNTLAYELKRQSH